MNRYERVFLNFCIAIYGGSYTIKGDLLLLKIDDDIFKINLRDGERFRQYTLFHRSTRPNADGKHYYHVQIKTRTLDFALFNAFTHSFNISVGIKYTTEDFIRFREDSKKHAPHFDRLGIV